MGIRWEIVMDFAYMGVFLLVATLLRNRIGFLQKYLIPNAIFAGFIGLLFSQQLLGLVDLPLDRLGDYVYHLLTVTFVAMGLRGSRVSHSYGAVATAVVHCKTYAAQILLGTAFVVVLILTYFPTLFPTFGMNLFLAFGNNPGVAYSLGRGWEEIGFIGGGGVGLTFGTVGFLIAYFVGIILINWGIKHKKTAGFKGYEQLPPSVRTGIVAKNEPKKEAGKLTTASEAVDTLSVQICLIGVVLVITYWTMRIVTGPLLEIGGVAAQFANLLWGFGFVVGIVYALLVRFLLDLFHLDHIIDGGLMTRLAGTSIDYMIMAAIIAIPILAIRVYWLEIAILSLLGGPLCLLLVYTLVYRIHRDFHFERFISSFGLLTGIMTSGLALLRVIDPDFETPVAEDLVYGGALIFFIGIPVMLLVNVPVIGYLQGQTMKYLLITMGLAILYILAIYAIWRGYKYLINRGQKNN